MKNELQIRKVVLSDKDILFRWSNDELVRAQSYSSESISYDEHCKWFDSKLQDQNSLLFIIEVGEVAASIVRFEIESETTIIAVSIDEKYRGKGYGSRFLKLAVEHYFKTNTKSVLAYIKKSNLASVKSFENAGFIYLKDELMKGHESVVYILAKRNSNE